MLDKVGHSIKVENRNERFIIIRESTFPLAYVIRTCLSDRMEPWRERLGTPPATFPTLIARGTWFSGRHVSGLALTLFAKRFATHFTLFRDQDFLATLAGRPASCRNNTDLPLQRFRHTNWGVQARSHYQQRTHTS